MRFSELLRYEEFIHRGASGPGEAQDWARRNFPVVAAAHGLRLVDLARPLPPTSGTYVLIGIAAAYAVPDLRALDEVSSALSKRTDERIEVLDISRPEYPPGMWELLRHGQPQGSVVAIWEAGRLVRSEFGARARKLLRSRYLGQT